MKIAVVIALNLCLVLANLYLLAQIPKWRKALWQLRQRLVLEERKIQAETGLHLAAARASPRTDGILIAGEAALYHRRKDAGSGAG